MEEVLRQVAAGDRKAVDGQRLAQSAVVEGAELEIPADEIAEAADTHSEEGRRSHHQVRRPGDAIGGPRVTHVAVAGAQHEVQEAVVGPSRT